MIFRDAVHKALYRHAQAMEGFSSQACFDARAADEPETQAEYAILDARFRLALHLSDMAGAICDAYALQGGVPDMPE